MKNVILSPVENHPNTDAALSQEDGQKTSPHKLAKLTRSMTSTHMPDEVFTVTENHPP